MFFLALFLDLMWLLGGPANFTSSFGGEIGQVDVHRTHGHLPGPVDPHFGGLADHNHHGQHGHLETTPGQGHVRH